MGIETPFITPRIVAEKYLYINEDTITRMCREGVFKTARKPSGRTQRGHWQIARAEVLAHIAKSHMRETNY